jgi:outer membrane protein OmpU
MNKMKKIGLSALAGSLVAFSANAVEMSVSGVAEVTYSTIDSTGTSQVNSGNPMGSNTSLSFSGSGDVGFGTATIVRTINDGGGAYLSASQTLDMGALGLLSFDSTGTGLEGVTAYDDKLPTAYEEVWNGISGSGVTGAGSNDTLGYSNSFGPIGISLAHTKGGTAASSDGNVAAETGDSVTDVHVTIDGSMLLDGLTLMAGSSTSKNTQPGATDTVENVGHILYSTGPISVGYRVAESQPGNGATVETGLNVEAMSVAFAVNDQLSVSYAQQDTEYDVVLSTANVTEEVTALNASYTVGAASLRATFSESDDDAGVQNANVEMTELSLVLSF